MTISDKAFMVSLPELGEGFADRARQLQQIEGAFFERQRRVVTITGPSGAGKTSTAALVAKGLSDKFDYVYAIQCRRGMGAETMLLELNHFFKSNSICELDEFFKKAVPLHLKGQMFGQILAGTKVLLVLDDADRLLGDQQMVDLLKAFINKCAKNTKFIFTSESGFDIMAGELADYMEEVPLSLDGNFHESVTKALAVIDDNALDVLCQCAAFGRPVQPEALHACIDGDTDAGALVQAGLLLKSTDSGALHYQVHELVHEAVKARCGESKWRAMTLKAAQGLHARGLRSGSMPAMLCAHELYAEAGQTQKAAELAMSIAEPLLSWGLLDTATGLLNQVINSQDARLKAHAILSMSNIYLRQGNHSKALETLKHCEETFASLQDERGVASALLMAGNVYLKQEDDLGLESFDRALKIFEKLDDKASGAGALVGKGLLHKAKARYDDALPVFHEALAIRDQLGDHKGIADALLQVGIIYSKKGMYEVALDTFRNAMGLVEQLGDKQGIAQCLTQMGKVHVKLEDYRMGLVHFLIAISIYESLKSTEIEAVKKQLALMHKRLGEEEFQRIYEEVMEERRRHQEGNKETGGNA